MKMEKVLYTFVSVFVFWFSVTAPVLAQVFKTQEQALSETFSVADTVIRKTVFLDKTQRKKLEALSKSKFNSRIISYYRGCKDSTVLGTAFFDAQIVRTKKAILQVVVSPDGRVVKVEVLAFLEPQDYLPIERWFTLFEGRKLTTDLWPGKAVHAVSGATLSVQSFTGVVRRALALHQFIEKGVE
ncbi:MAG: FMN-binding protein [Calditrichaeota bacterium]|nr:MAG: FMN-binding protein [Calditrichota bacterium]